MGSEVTLRSPLKFHPLRNPGQSLEEKIRRVIDDRGGRYILVSVAFIGIAVFEWLRYYRPSEPNPWAMTALTIPVVGYSAIRILRSVRNIRSLRLGMDGEKAAWQSLEELRANGAVVFHDVCAKEFHADHVVVSPQGIYVIETKTFGKSNGWGATVTHDGKELFVNGHAPGRDPVNQVQANSTWVEEMLRERTGRSFPVRPVVLFPGRCEETENTKAHDKVWLLNPKRLLSFVQHEHSALPPEDVESIAFHLSCRIRGE